MHIPTLSSLKSGTGRWIEIDEKRYLFFGGTSYLGIAGNTDFQALVWEGIQRYGVNYGASRINNIKLDVYDRAEAEIAKRSGAEDAIILSSGYLAGQLVIQHYAGACCLAYAPDAHPALWIEKPQKTLLSYNDWVEQIIKKINSSDNNKWIIIVNSVNNIFPQRYTFEWLGRLSRDKDLTLLVDDSHGLGINALSGEGIYSSIPQLPHVAVIVVASMAKGLGIDAGVILANKNIIQKLRQSPVYAGSSPPSPALLYAYIHAGEIYQAALQKLMYNTMFFSGLINSIPSINCLNHFPIFELGDPSAYLRLMDQGIIISSFPYPDAEGKSINRVVISSLHEEEDMKKLSEALLF